MNSFLKFLVIVFGSVFTFITIGYTQVTFTKHTIDNNFGGANSVYAIDVNGDSLVDVLGAGLGANSISLWLNNGGYSITWSEQAITNNFTAASSVYAADFDNDGDVDVLGSAWSLNEIAWWQNNGGNPIQWSKHVISSNFNGAEEVFTADVDSDGDMDVLGAAMTGNQIAWWRNDGGNPIQWNQEIVRSAFSWARSVFSYDVNGDSLMDILGAAYNANDIAVWYQNSDSTWTEQIIDNNFFGAHKVISLDLDNDGDADILSAAHVADDVAWWRNDGGNPIQWTKDTIDQNLDGAISVYATDFDGDGDIDVLAGAEVGHDVVLYYNNGGNPISWSKQTIDGNFAGAWTVYAEDVNSDGNIDVLAAASYANDIAWWENEGVTGIENYNSFPNKIELKQNYPNPFNPNTIISYQILEFSFVILKVYDVLGNEVETLVDGEKLAGEYEVEFSINNSQLTSGIYFYQLEVYPAGSGAGSYIQTKKMVLLK